MKKQTEKSTSYLPFRGAGIMGVAFALIMVVTVHSGQQTSLVPHLFQSGDPALASEVNENFLALEDEINALKTFVSQISPLIRVETGEIDGVQGPHIIVEGANLHVRSGSNATDDGGALTGLGNIIVGYNEAPTTLAAGDRMGSHNIIQGQRNIFTSHSGRMGGADNIMTGEFASILSGQHGTASGAHSVIVTGGGITDNLFNNASGDYAAILGGFRNEASGAQSVVSGGSNNHASDFLTSVTGGTSNEASVAGATVSGGAGNLANGANASISGGQGGTATGVSSCISGGLNLTVTNNFDWRACDITCP